MKEKTKANEEIKKILENEEVIENAKFNSKG